jgi:hypothetical protein
MCWSLIFTTLLETVNEEVQSQKRKDESLKLQHPDGGILALSPTKIGVNSTFDVSARRKEIFQSLMKKNLDCVSLAIHDAVAFAKSVAPRDQAEIDAALGGANKTQSMKESITTLFAANVWPSLKSRGWKAKLVTEGDQVGQTIYQFENQEVNHLWIRDVNLRYQYFIL